MARTPAGRWGQADELADTAVYLAAAASGFVTGETIRGVYDSLSLSGTESAYCDADFLNFVTLQDVDFGARQAPGGIHVGACDCIL